MFITATGRELGHLQNYQLCGISMVSLDRLLHEIWNHHGNKCLDHSVRDYLVIRLTDVKRPSPNEGGTIPQHGSRTG